MSRWIRMALWLAVLALPVSGASAAVRLCQSSVSSGLQEAKSEQEAKALAISAWITAASAHGQAYTAWRLATGKFFNCSRTASGAFQCLAKAEPCAVFNAPPPPGTFEPRRPGGVSG